MIFKLYKVNACDELLVAACAKSIEIDYLFPEGIDKSCQWQYSEVEPAVYLSWCNNETRKKIIRLLPKIVEAYAGKDKNDEAIQTLIKERIELL